MFNICKPYSDQEELKQITKKLESLPGIIQPQEITNLKNLITKASLGQAAILQAGDCAERFCDAGKHATKSKQKQLIKLAKTMKKQHNEIIIIGRIAGQFAKPRSEIWQGDCLSYHGDIINSLDKNDRQPKAYRMLTAYKKSQEIYSYLKWPGQMIFTSHECLVLPYEQALTKNSAIGKVNLGSHLLWLGARSIDNQALINYLASVNNPVAIKLPPKATTNQIRTLLYQLNPLKQNNKIILISRIGYQQVSDTLPAWIALTKQLDFKITWLCDPMHANTKVDVFKQKYRLIQDISAEINQTKKEHQEQNNYLAGIHLEITPSLVEECLEEITNKTRIYTSAVDPRLNPKQATKIIKTYLE